MSALSKSTKGKHLKSTQELTELMNDVLLRVKKKGGSDAAVAVSHNHGFSVDVRMGTVDTVAFNEDKGVSVCIYLGHRKGEASSTDVSSAAINNMIEAAFEIAKVSAEDPCFGLAPRELMQTDYPDLDLYHPWSVNPSQAIEVALSCEAAALAMDQRITNSNGVNVSTYSFCRGYANTNGCEGVSKSTRHSMSRSLVGTQDGAMQSDYHYTVARHPDNMLAKEDLARQAVQRTVSRLGSRKLKTQRNVPVVFSSRVSSSLFSTLVNAISGSNLYRQHSFLCGAIDKTIFPANIRVHEQPYLLGALGSSAFDEEGIPTRNNVFVDDGVLRQYILGCYSARKLNLNTTANNGGVFNLTVDPTLDGGLEDILRLMGKGLLVTDLMGSGANVLTGDYSRGASGFWVEDGQIQYPVEEITIAGHLGDMFRTVAAVGYDINPNLSTRCGSVLLESMTIAGE